MDLPPNAEQLGTSAEQLPISSAGVLVTVQLTPAGQRYLAARAGNAAPERVCLALENVRGTHDATVLNVYLSQPEDEQRGARPQLVVGSAALYGLRLASNPRGSNRAGLTLVFELNSLLAEPDTAQLLQGNELHLRVAPSRPLPEKPDITIGRVSVFRLPPK